MLQEITRATAAKIKNPVFRDYANMYLNIYDNFAEQVEQFGLPFHKAQDHMKETEEIRAQLADMQILNRCEGASLVYNRISPACEACKKGVGTLTSYVSFRCHRHCFFCFNPNQDNYEANCVQKADWEQDLMNIKAEGGQLTHVALTGGEPLLHPDDCVAFFIKSRELFPLAHTRLYTSGDLLTADMLQRLKDAGLDEIRFSYKIEDSAELKEKVLNNMALAKEYITSVMVEMPVMPDAEEEMQGLLTRLDEMGIFGINLLELCFPYNNAEAFKVRGYELKYPPYRTLYNFWYAGGLPVAGSELVALRLMRFAAEKKMKLGIHYCSLENKNFGQMYQQNKVLSKAPATMYFSPKDYYLKGVKAFGADAIQVRRILEKAGVRTFTYDKENEFILFHPQYARLFKGRNMELALSINVMEPRGGEVVARELKLLRALPGDCDPEKL